MRPEQPECEFCGVCRNENQNPGLNVEDGCWLEEIGDLIRSSVDGMKTAPRFLAYCHEMADLSNNNDPIGP